jgi:hypothetical protein
MELTNQKIRQWSAVLAITGVLIYISFPFTKFLPFSNETIPPALTAIGLTISIPMWLTGNYLWHLREIKTTGLVGYAMSYLYIGCTI